MVVSDLILRIRRRVNDPDSLLYDDAFVIDAVNEGLLALGDFSGQVLEKSWTPDKFTSSFALPSDFLRLVMVPPLRSSSSGGTLSAGGSLYLRSYRPEPGEIHYESDDIGAPEGIYILNGQLVVADGVSAGDTLTLIYEARWPGVADPVDVLELPYWAERAIAYYMNFYLLQHQGNKFARDGYHKTTYDSGRPTDNPALESADWFYAKFEAIAIRNMRKGA